MKSTFQLPAIWAELGKAGLESGHAYGKALRTVKSCVGSTWCRYGVQDAVSFAVQIENRYKGKPCYYQYEISVRSLVLSQVFHTMVYTSSLVLFWLNFILCSSSAYTFFSPQFFVSSLYIRFVFFSVKYFGSSRLILVLNSFFYRHDWFKVVPLLIAFCSEGTTQYCSGHRE